jgi:hypothetical protein
MKIQNLIERRKRNGQRPESGSVLVVTLILAIITGVTLGSYLLMVQSQDTSVVRSQAWNGALVQAEAGVEEVMAHLNPGMSLAPPNLSVDGWGSPSGGFYGPVSRTMNDGSYSVVFTTDNPPVIYSTGYVTIPALSATLTRVVRVGVSNVPVNRAPMVSIHDLNFNGGGIITDSFNSSLTNLSNNGQYDPTKTSTNGTIATVFGPFYIGSHTIDGSVLLGPDVAYHGGQNQVLGSISTNFNPTFEDVTLPSNFTTNLLNTSIAQQNVTVGGTNYAWAFIGSGDYTLPNLNGNTYIASNAIVRLLVLGNSTPNLITVDGAAASSGNLTIFMAGSSFTISGGNFVNGGVAANLSYLGLPSNTSITMSGNSGFIGTIYAPEANVTLTGGGSNPYNLVGSLLANTITLNGKYNFHYDEALMKSQLGPYVACSWREL